MGRQLHDGGGEEKMQSQLEELNGTQMANFNLRLSEQWRFSWREGHEVPPSGELRAAP